MPNTNPTTFSLLFSEIEGHANAMRSLIMAQIAETASTTPDESDWVFTCASAVKSIDSRKAELSKIADELIGISENILGLKCDTEGLSHKRLRTLDIEVSEGMINQSLLNLTSAKRRGTVRLGETFKIKLPDGVEFETDLINPGNKLRERGKIREFYREHDVAPDDHVIMEEQAPGVWTLSLRPETEIDLHWLDDSTQSDDSAKAPNSPALAEKSISLTHSWTDRRPSGYSLCGKRYIGQQTWSGVFEHLLRELQTIDAARFDSLPDRPEAVSTHGNRYFSHSATGLRQAFKLTETVFIEKNLSANRIREIIRRVLKIYDIADTEVEFFIRNVPRA